MTMNGETKENLKDLFEKFVSSKQAEQAVEDIRKGEQILHGHNAPEPDSKLIADIKAGITASLLHKKENAFRRIIYKTAAIAAAFILIAVISIKLFESNQVQQERTVNVSTIPKAVWNSNCLADDSAESATLLAEIEQIEREVLALRFDENGSNYYETATELEMELTEINGDFWKG